MDRDTARIAIVGAGLAGLSAAEHLHRHGYSHVLLLEAGNRIGGRVYTKQFGRTQKDVVEIGANWLHGPALSNSVFTLANQAGLMKEWRPLDRMKGFCYTSDGRGLEKALTDRLWAGYQRWEAELPDYTDLDSRPNIEDYMNRRFEEELHEYPVHAHDDLRCVLNCLHNYERFHCAGDISTMPLPPLIKQRVPGGNVQVMEGLWTLCEHLEKQLPPGTVKLQSEVTAIQQQPEGQVQVRCRDGHVYTADHVLVTVSVGVLKHVHHTLFQPPLPDNKVKAINTIKFGSVAKVFLEWERPFWREGSGSIKLCWSDRELAGAHPKKHWYKWIFSFDEVMNNRHVLVGWLSGEAAQHMEQLPEQQVRDTCTQLIRQFLRDPAIPAPVKLTRSTFNTDPLFRGSYIHVDYATRPQTFHDYAAPVCDSARVPRVLFAGEATCHWAYSTMHGARTSGVREAQRLIDVYRPASSRL